MKGDKIISGIIVIVLGIVFLLANLGIVHWSIFANIIDLWPLFLIIAGVSIIFKSRVVTGIAWLLFFTVFIGYGIVMDTKIVHIGGTESGKIVYSKSVETTKAELNLSLGGAKVEMEGTDDYLLYGEMNPNNVRHSIKHYDNGKRAMIHVENEGTRVKLNTSNQQNKYSFKLSEEVEWDIIADMGAVSGDLDLEEIKVNRLDLNMGAGNVKLNLGDKQDLSKVIIKAGAGNIDIALPKNVGVKMHVQGLLSKVNVERLGLTQSGNEYTSPNYEEAEKKINLDITVGAGKLDVKLYE